MATTFLLNHIIGFFGILLAIFLVIGLFRLVIRVFSVRNFDLGFKFRNASPEARQLANLSAALIALMAGTLLFVAWATAPITYIPGVELFWGAFFLGWGITYLVRGLRSKPGQ